jgi:site-specific recombinase XerD
MPMPHSIIHGDACFAYFNKSRDIPHACGYRLANDGQDTRAVQHYLGRKNIQHMVRYTELSPERFKSSLED